MSLRKSIALFVRQINLNKSILNCTARRGAKEGWKRPFHKSLYNRRLDQGPEPDRPASAWSNWNYDSELFAFGKRLGEEFKEDNLKRAFINRSYVLLEAEKRKELNLESDFSLEDNEDLVPAGEKLIEQVLTKFLKESFSLIPEEGIEALVKHLSSDATLCYISSNLGVKDLVLTKEFPPSEETMSKTFKAVIAVLHKDQGYERVEKFIKDLIAVQLIGQRIDEIWNVFNPMGLLVDELNKLGMEPPEPRLIWSAGRNTKEACYVIGIYSNKELIGKSPGETVPIAEEMAARDALRNLYQINDSRPPLKF